MARITFKVSFTLPEGSSRKDAQHYVWDAVSTMKGCLHHYDPENEDIMERGDPFSMLDAESVKVTWVRPK